LLGRLSGALGMSLSELVARAEGDRGRLARATDQPVWIDPATSYRRRALSPAPGGPIELVEVELPAGASVAYPADAFTFLHHQIWVLEGELRFREGGRRAPSPSRRLSRARAAGAVRLRERDAGRVSLPHRGGAAMSAIAIRPASPADAAGCARVYASYVTDSCISFEYEPPTAEDFAARMASAHAWMVAEDRGAVVGYAYASRHRERAAYDWAADVAIYIAATHHGRGLGRGLYEPLFARAAELGIRTLCAGVAQPNAPSDALHRSLGFAEVGVYRRIGWKAGRWHDVRWWQLHLSDASPPPARVGG
jgi:L-amino acid N-acyltransferase YncA